MTERIDRWWAGLACVALLGCGSTVRPFPLEEPMWEDPDRNHVEVRPEEYWSPFAWDGLDQTIFRPLTRVFAVDPVGPAPNVNAFDEVPNSSWFENRIGRGDYSLERAREGSCPDERIDWSGPWTVTDAKPNGANPGFIIRAADGRRYLLKFDGFLQPLRGTSGDVFGSRLYQAVGFHAPCNFIVAFDPAEQLVMDPEAETENALGQDVPMTQEDVDRVLDAAYVYEDGRIRASASLFLPGRPLGPWTYQDRRSDDPNDVIDHENRRELRGGRVLAAWLNHFDAREQNTLSMWVSEDGTDYVRHHYIDFGDSFGSDWEIESLTARIGHSNYLDLSHVLEDLATLGALWRPWYHNRRSEAAWIYGYYDAAFFEPERWEPGYPNPAFSRMTEDDGAWMARIIAYVGDDEVRVMLDEAGIDNPEWDAELYHTLLARRDRILNYYLRVRSPLSHFEVDRETRTTRPAASSEVGRRPVDREPDDQPAGRTEYFSHVYVPAPAGTLPNTLEVSASDWVCFTDLGAMTGLWDPRMVRYTTRMFFDDFSEHSWRRSESVLSQNDDARRCVALVENGLRPAAEAGSAAPDAIERYAVLDIWVHPEPGDWTIPPVRLHFYDLGEDEGFRLVGVERPDDDDPPDH